MTVFVEVIAEFWDYKRNRAVPVACNFQADKMDWAPMVTDVSPGTTVGFPTALRTVRITDFKEDGTYVGREYTSRNGLLGDRSKV